MVSVAVTARPSGPPGEPASGQGGTDAKDLFVSFPCWEGDDLARSRAYRSTWVRVAIKTRLNMGMHMRYDVASRTE